jgi:CheY-like chemotaxis protein
MADTAGCAIGSGSMMEKPTILIVDDSQDDITLISELLKDF